jgi:hypothetical protein
MEAEHFPGLERLREIERLVIEKYKLKDEEIDVESTNMGTGEMRVVVSIETEREDEPIVAALETFFFLLSDTKITKRILEYRRG